MKSETTSFFKEEQKYGRDLSSSFRNDEKLTYDQAAKRILSNKVIVAYILQAVVPEFKDMQIERICNLLKSGDTDTKIECHKEDDERTGMALISFDVNARLEFKNLNIDVEIDIEPQNKLHPGYSIYKRGVYYCSRMIDRQLGYNDKNNYDLLHKCYSIWICFQSDGNANMDMLSYRLTRDAKSQEVPILSAEAKKADSDVDLFELDYIYVPKAASAAKQGICELLYGIFRRDLEHAKDYLSTSDYNAIEQEVTIMGRLEEDLRNESEAIGIIKGKAEGKAEGELEGKLKVIENLLVRGMPLEEALEITELDKEIWQKYKELGSVDKLVESLNFENV